MRILIAGATGVIGRPTLSRLEEAGHDVTALARPGRTVPDRETVNADLLDSRAVTRAVRAARPDVVVHLATALPDPVNPRHIRRQMAATNELRTRGTANLIAGAQAAGAWRLVAESLAYAYDPGCEPVCDEQRPLWLDPPGPYAPSIAALRELERRVTDTDGAILRFGHLYGPGSTYDTRGGTTRLIREGKLPLIGEGGSIFSFIHASDAADAILAAAESDRGGVFNVVDDDPAPVEEWLPEAARVLGAPEPKHVPAWLARLAVGSFGVAFMTALRGADNSRAREELGWTPRHSSWRNGLSRELSPVAQAA
jgi:nucleoside-diphosphate-sugar epimerase